MGKLPVNTESQMKSVTVANSLFYKIAGPSYGTKKNALSIVIDACDKFGKSFTERRLRSFRDKDCAGVDFDEIADLVDVMGKQDADRLQDLQKQQRIIQARKEHKEYVDETARIAGLVERAYSSVDGPSRSSARSELGRMDRTRT